MKLNNAIVAITCAVLAATPLIARTWTSADGKTVKADLVSFDGETAVLKRLGSTKEFRIPLTGLSAADQEYLKNLEQGAAGGEPSAKKPTVTAPVPRGRRGNFPADLKPNFDDKWPERVIIDTKFEIREVAEPVNKYKDSVDASFIYHSPHYEFVCDVRLSKSLVKKFAIMFEATYEAMAQLPMFHRPALIDRSDSKLPIVLCESRESYIKNGGIPGSAGVYSSRSNRVLVPLTSLGVKTLGSKYTIDYKVANETLPHELCHQLTDPTYYAVGSRGWFSEGLAEYVSVSPRTNSGRIDFKNNVNDIRDSFTSFDRKARTGSGLGDEVYVQHLKDFMMQSYSDFTADSRINYALGMLTTTYFIHMDRGGDRSALNKFLKALQAGKTGEEALEVLRDGRSWFELESDIQNAWRRKGIKINFGSK